MTFSDIDEEITPTSLALSPVKPKVLFLKTINAEGTIYTNQIGRFPTQSWQGNKMIMTFYDVDGNYIDVEPMRDHRPNSMLKAYQVLWD